MEDILKSQLFITLIGLLGAWIVGNALATRWQLIRKRKELELETAQRFYRLYGEFFSIWKIWNQHLEDTTDTGRSVAEEVRTALHERAAEMEGAIEATLLKIAAEVGLSPDEQHNLGQLRQAFGVVRYCIRHRMEIPFYSSEDEHYRALKDLSTAAGVLLAKPLGSSRSGIFGIHATPSETEAHAAWIEITSNKHEGKWKGYLRKLSTPADASAAS